MLTPCSPCVLPGGPCEQCMFGYQSKTVSHERMRELITRVKNGEKPVGWTLVENYKLYHPNWEEEMKGEAK